MRPPECDVCGAEVDPGADPVRFRPNEASEAWAVRTADGAVGHPPDVGWFCGVHRPAAVEAARTMSYPDGLAEIIAVTGWEPPSPTPRRASSPAPAPVAPPVLGTGPPKPAAFDARDHVLVDPAELPGAVSVPGRSSEDVGLAIHRRRDLLLAALTPDAYRMHWSGGSNAVGEVRHPTSYGTAGDRMIFGATDVELDDAGNRSVRSVEQRVERAGRVEVLLRCSASGSRTVTDIGSGEPMPALDRLVVWIGDERFRAWAEAIAAELRTTPEDLLDPSPDLVGVDLAGGRLRAVRSRRPRQWVEWDINRIAAEVVRDHVVALVAELAAAESQRLPELMTTTRRHYTPMDGAREPNCPFTDTETHTGTGDGVGCSLQITRDHYDEGSPHRVSIRLRVEGLRAHPDPLVLAAYGGNRDYLTTLTLQRPTTPDLVARVGAIATAMPRKPKGRRGH